MGQRKQRQEVADQPAKTRKEEERQRVQHRIAWVPASPSLGYGSALGEAPELNALRRTCSEFEREGYRLVSVSALVGVIDPALGGMGTVGWYLFFVRDVEPSSKRRLTSEEPPDYLRRERVEDHEHE